MQRRHLIQAAGALPVASFAALAARTEGLLPVPSGG